MSNPVMPTTMTRANEAAYPVNTENVSNGGAFVPQLGLTIREHFAAMAMQGIASRAHLESNSMAAIAALSVQMADALIAALAQDQRK